MGGYSNPGGVGTEKPGDVKWHAANAVPYGWLKCNGAAISRAAYPALFAAIGTTFGAGDGATTFNIPDLRGEFVRGFDDGRGADSGRAFGSAQGFDVQAHAHGATTGNGGTSNWGVSRSGGDSSRAVTDAVASTGGAETRPRNVAMLPCIKF